MPSRRPAFVIGPVLLVALAACGGEAVPDTTEPAITTTSVPTATTGAPPSTSPAPEPAVLALSSGRGDDASLEITVWLGADPRAIEGHRVVVGVDADDSYAGVGDPFLDLDGHLEITASGAALFDAGAPIATGADLGEHVSWGYAEGILRVFFIGAVPARAGTVWVMVESGGEPVALGVAGAPFGSACSFHASGLVADAPTAIPDAGTACRYPLG